MNRVRQRICSLGGHPKPAIGSRRSYRPGRWCASWRSARLPGSMRLIGLAFILSLTLAPLAAEAQPAAKVYRIGLLGSLPPTAPGASRIWEGFFQGLQELGYVEGQNILIEGRFYGDRTERLPALAAELVRLKVDVIVAQGPPAPEAAQRATSTIPIVMTVHQDPVGSGLVASLARPGRNVTGLSVLTTELGRQAAAVAQGGRSRNLPRGRALGSDPSNRCAPVERGRGRGAIVEGAASRAGSAGSQRFRQCLLGDDERPGGRTHRHR